MLFSALSHFFFWWPPLWSWLSIFRLIFNLAHSAHNLPRCKLYTVLFLLNYENVETFLKLYRYLNIIFKKHCKMQINFHMYDTNKMTVSCPIPTL